MSWSLNLSGNAFVVRLELQKIHTAIATAIEDMEPCGSFDKVNLTMSGSAFNVEGKDAKLGMGLNYSFAVEIPDEDCDCEQCGLCGEPDKNLIN